MYMSLLRDLLDTHYSLRSYGICMSCPPLALRPAVCQARGTIGRLRLPPPYSPPRIFRAVIEDIGS